MIYKSILLKNIIILSLNLIYILIYKKGNLYVFCQCCIKKQFEGCFRCTSDILLKSIKIHSIKETLKEIIANRASIARFGDGEFNLIFGNDIKFQKFNKTLKDKLLNILNSNIPNLLVGIIQLYNNTSPFWVEWVENNKFKIAKIINKNKTYYNAAITRFYFRNSNKTEIKHYIYDFKKIWNNRNILTIEGKKTRLGIGNDLFNNAKSIKRIICPEENSFNVYGKILNYIETMKIDKKVLILISLGPTATVLTYELFKLGNQIIDFGHFDIQYEYYLRNASKAIRIPNKYVNEVSKGSFNITPVFDQNYYKQIINIIE